MRAQALVCDARQQFRLEEVELPRPGARELLVRTLCSGVSIGTEFALIRHKISWGPYPLCTGYMAVGVVEEAGDEALGFAPGDRVYYRLNAPLRRPGGEAVSSVSGTHCSHAVTPAFGDHAAARLPDEAPVEESAMFVLPAVGLYGVDMAGPRAGDRVLVHGAGLIGLGVVAACAARGGVVTAVDPDAAARARARAFGADYVLDPTTDDIAEHLRRLSPESDGADVTFECTGIPGCLDTAMRLTRTHGAFVWQGNYGEAPVALQFMTPHMRRLRMFFPCDDGHAPCRRAVIKNMARGVLPWDKAITHRLDAADAPAAYAAMNAGDRTYAGVVLRWSR